MACAGVGKRVIRSVFRRFPLSYRYWVLLTLVAATSLGGCDAFYRAIGRDKVVPDEFAGGVARTARPFRPIIRFARPASVRSARREEAPVDQARQTVFRAGEDAKSNLPPAADNRSAGEGEC